MRKIKIISRKKIQNIKKLTFKYAGKIYTCEYILFDDLHNFLKKLNEKRKCELLSFKKQIVKENLIKEQLKKSELFKKENQNIIEKIKSLIDKGIYDDIKVTFTNNITLISINMFTTGTKYEHIIIGYLYRNSWSNSYNNSLKLYRFDNIKNLLISLFDRKIISGNYQIIKFVDLAN